MKHEFVKNELKLNLLERCYRSNNRRILLNQNKINFMWNTLA